MMLCRLNSSPYYDDSFYTKESNLAHKAGLAYISGLPEKGNCAIIAISNTHTQIKKVPGEILSRIKLWIHPNSGHDNFSYDWVQEQKFPIILGNEIRAHAVANFILSQLLNHFSPIHHQNKWDPKRSYPRTLLCEQSVIILGHGHIGKILEKSLAPLVKNLLVHDPLQNKTASTLAADIVIPVTSLTESSHHFIDRFFLSKLPNDFCLINSSRAEVIVTNDLIEILKKRPQASAYLDVFDQEPCLFEKQDNLKTTSHIAGVYKNIDLTTLEFEHIVIQSFLNKKIDNFKHIDLRQKTSQEFI